MKAIEHPCLCILQDTPEPFSGYSSTCMHQLYTFCKTALHNFKVAELAESFKYTYISMEPFDKLKKLPQAPVLS